AIVRPSSVTFERLVTGSGIVVGSVRSKCVRPGGSVINSGLVSGEGARAYGHVSTANGIAKKCVCTLRCVVGADGVPVKRVKTSGRVVGASVVGRECSVTGGCVVAASGV